MSDSVPKELLRRLRNDIPIEQTIAGRLGIPCKTHEGVFRFLCPLCGEFQTATNLKTNLGRCFRCKRNFNPIDIVMAATPCGFLEAVNTLRSSLD